MEVKIISPMGENVFELSDEAVFRLIDTAFKAAAEQYKNSVGGGKTITPPVIEEEPDLRPVKSEEPIIEKHDDVADEGYKGFLYIKCEKCGLERAFCAKQKIKYSRCFCNHNTKLHDLRNMYVECPNCGGKYKYKTNMTEKTFSLNCVGCGSPIDVEENARRSAYVPLK